VLVTGESGTGKELIARAIHLKSDRSSGPFVAVNCGALPEGVLESELFGHEKGAFTGATALRKGRFEIADGGTLLLDEVGEMPQSTQVKLLRVLEEERFMRVGGSQDVKVDARVIAASNRDLREDVESSLFRRDLYYRLNVVHIHVPPLRERRGDIPTIFLGLAEEAASRNALRFGGITGDALEVMERYEWPGNVRELRNLAESLVVISKGRRVGVNDLPEHILRPGASSAHLPVVAGRPRHEMELRLVMTGLARIEDRLMDLKDLILGRKGGLPPDSRVLGEEIPSGIVHFKEVPQGGEIVVEPGTPLRDVERELIRTTLAAVGGNRKKAARLLGMGERTLYRRMKEYDIS
jgi:DNA-binding NtrC family response regulator